MVDRELLNLISSEYERISPNSCWDFIKNRDRRIPCLQNLQKRFNGTYNDILMMSGISDDKLNFVRRDKYQYLEKLKEVSNRLGYVPSQNEFSKLGYSPQLLIRYFGSYSGAIKEIGGDPLVYKTSTKVKESNEELLKMYIDYSNKIGKPASWGDLLNSIDIYNPDIFTIRFGSMQNLKIQAGFPPITTNKIRYTKESVKEILIELYIQKNGKLTVEEIKSNENLPSYSTILHKFQTTSILNVWKEIEIEIINMKHVA